MKFPRSWNLTNRQADALEFILTGAAAKRPQPRTWIALARRGLVERCESAGRYVLTDKALLELSHMFHVEPIR